MKLREVLQEVSRREEVQSNKEYKILGVRWYAKGLFVKEVKKGSEIQATYIYKVNKGDFVYSRLFAWKGSFAIATDEFDECYVSNEFPCFHLNEKRLNIEFLMWYFSQPDVWDSCLEKSEGSTAISRNRLKVDKFLGMSIPLPLLEIQEKAVGRLEFVNKKSLEIMNIKYDSEKKISSLRQSILQEAVQGKLVPQDPNDESASILLEKIKAEKEQLIKEKKIKKEKPLPEITEDEIPYKVPQGWEWIRLGSVLHSTNNGIYKPENFYSDDGVVSLRMYNIQNGKIVFNELTRINLTDEEKSTYRLIPGDIILNRVNSKELVGKSAIIEEYKEDLVYESMNVRLRFIENRELPKYINKYLLTSMVREIINGFSKQAISQASINQSQIRNILIPLPPLREQKRIVDKVDQLMTLCDELKQTVTQSKQESEMLMQAVLQEAFSITEKDNNVVEFPIVISTDIEDWEIAARSDGEIDLETKAKIKARVTELLSKSK
jgi:restriction endonuclease S subunit